MIDLITDANNGMVESSMCERVEYEGGCEQRNVHYLGTHQFADALSQWMQINFIPTRFASRSDVCDVFRELSSALLSLLSISSLLRFCISNRHWERTLTRNFQLLQFGTEHPERKPGAHAAKTERLHGASGATVIPKPSPDEHTHSHWGRTQQNPAEPSCASVLSTPWAGEPRTSRRTANLPTTHLQRKSQMLIKGAKALHMQPIRSRAALDWPIRCRGEDRLLNMHECETR